MGITKNIFISDFSPYMHPSSISSFDVSNFFIINKIINNGI